MHTYILGSTRSGKSNYLLSLIQDSQGAFAFIDKHGEAARQIADAYPVIYWKPADLSHIISLNPLQNVAPDERWKRTADLVSIFSDNHASRYVTDYDVEVWQLDRVVGTLRPRNQGTDRWTAPE